MQTYLNTSGVSLSVAVYLATDHYDYIPNTISATGLIRPLRQTILGSRVPSDLARVDVTTMVKSRMGTSIHDGIEKSWTNPKKRHKALLALGYPVSVIERIMVNPEKLLRKLGYSDESLHDDLYMETGEVSDATIPVFMEIRSFREIMGRRISGKFDFVAEGRVEDFKSTGTFTWSKGNKIEDYQLQGSIYRWLNPQIITQDEMAIRYLFTDHMAGKAKGSPAYPKNAAETLWIPLLSLEETEAYIVGRLQQHDALANAHESDMPQCTDKELWRKESVYKYYSNPDKRARSSGNFDTLAEANKTLAEKGKGIVVEVPGEVVACKYCKAFPICTQKDIYLENGSLIL